MVRWFSIICLCLLPHVAAAEVSASLNQYIVPFGESVQLSVKAQGSIDGEPDMTVLKQDFDILSQSQSSNFSMVNGSISRSKTWDYNLMPKREGMIQVPAITVGNETTQALMLRVLDSNQQQQAGKVRDIWLEVSLSADEVYVQAQAILTIKLLRSVNLSQAELSEPNIQDAIVERLGDNKNYEEVVGGRRVIVTERKYAVFPQHSGDLSIPSVQFDGVISGGRSMFAAGRVKRLRSQALALHVIPKSTAWDKHNVWLPAQAVELQEILPDGQIPEYCVGEPFTRTIELKVQGLTSAQLPLLLEGKQLAGFKLYPDQPELSQGVNSQGLVGIRLEKVAMIPTQPRKLVLPEIRVKWWNTQTEQVQSAVIAAREIEVLPAVQSSVSMQSAQTETQLKPNKPQALEPKKEQMEARQVENNGNELWKWFALIFAASWFITMYLWWRVSRKAVANQQVKQSTHSKLPAIKKKLKVACAANDEKQVLDLLPQWGAAFYEDESIQNLVQLKGRSDKLDKALGELQALRYAPQRSHPQEEKADWSGHGLWQVIQGMKDEQKKNDGESLRPLYK